jgi:hypothetical protein
MAVCGDCDPRPGASKQEAAQAGQEAVKTLAGRRTMRP